LSGETGRIPVRVAAESLEKPGVERPTELGRALARNCLHLSLERNRRTSCSRGARASRRCCMRDARAPRRSCARDANVARIECGRRTALDARMRPLRRLPQVEVWSWW